MEKNTGRAGELDLSALMSEVLRNSEKLIGQQFSLLKSEVGQEFRRAGGAAAAMGAGAGLVGVSGFLSTLMAVHLLHRATRLPLWSCYGLIAGLSAAAGVGLLMRGQRQASNLQLGLPQTVEALKENLTWLKEQATSTPA